MRVLRGDGVAENRYYETGSLDSTSDPSPILTYGKDIT